MRRKRLRLEVGSKPMEWCHLCGHTHKKEMSFACFSTTVRAPLARQREIYTRICKLCAKELMSAIVAHRIQKPTQRKVKR